MEQSKQNPLIEEITVLRAQIEALWITLTAVVASSQNVGGLRQALERSGEDYLALRRLHAVKTAGVDSDPATMALQEALREARDWMRSPYVLPPSGDRAR